MTIEFLVEVKEHYSDEAPEAFGFVRFPHAPKNGDVVMLKWLDGRDAYEVTVIDDSKFPELLHVSRDAELLARKNLKPRILCKCVVCGVVAEISNQQPIPAGWHAFTAAHWPAGSERLPALYLRVCGPCWDRTDQGPQKEGKPPAPAFEPPVVTPIGNLHDLLSQVCVHTDDLDP